MADQNYLNLLVIAESQDTAERLNSVLRSEGHFVRPVWAADQKTARDIIREQIPDVIFLDIEHMGLDLDDVIKFRDDHCAGVPVVGLCRGDISNDVNADAIMAGASDLVSTDTGPRLVAVTLREAQASRDRRELVRNRTLLSQYQARFEELLHESGDAIAYVQDGIHMEANPNWLETFGYGKHDIVGIPVMDLFFSEDHGTVKKALRDAAKGKEIPELELTGMTAEGDTFPVKLEITQTELEGEPCLELAIRAEGEDTSELQAQMADLAKRDPLTGLFHRHHFVDLLDEEMNQRKTAVAQAVLFIKPDEFSAIDDKVGPIASDTVLKLFGELLQNQLQNDDMGARFGGNIFTAIVNRPSVKEIEAWAEEFRAAVAGHVFEAGGQSLNMTASIGIADFATNANGAGALISLAQQANKQAREEGGNRSVLWRSQSDEESGGLSDVGWIRLITGAIKQNRFQLVYQPIAPLQGTEDNLFDVLVRMLDEDDKEIMPAEFMPAAERNGLMVGVDRWVVEHAFKVLGDRSKAGKQSSFFIRLSNQSVMDGSLAGYLKQLIDTHGLAPNSVVVQIPERAAELHIKEVVSLSQKLHDMQCRVALEHFGVGRNSMQILEHVKLDFIKIDGSLINTLEKQDVQDKVRQLIAKSKETAGAASVAERVETANAMATLFQLGVDYIQGNYVQEPEVVMAED